MAARSDVAVKKGVLCLSGGMADAVGSNPTDFRVGSNPTLSTNREYIIE